MKLEILGTAAATALPLPFCKCEVCEAARKLGGKDNRKRSAALINEELLIDLSPDLCSMAAEEKIDLSKIKYLLQTHSHADHFDAGHLITRCSGYKVKGLMPLDIICSKGTCDDMNRWLKQNGTDIDLYEPHWQEDMKLSLNLIKAGESRKLGAYTITALDSMHDAHVEALIYIIEHDEKTLLYGTDLGMFTEATWQVMKQHKYDVVILDQTYGGGKHMGHHLTAEKVAETVKKMKQEGMADAHTAFYATHLSHEGNSTYDKMEAQACMNGYHIAWDGCELQL